MILGLFLYADNTHMNINTLYYLNVTTPFALFCKLNVPHVARELRNLSRVTDMYVYLSANGGSSKLQKIKETSLFCYQEKILQPNSISK